MRIRSECETGGVLRRNVARGLGAGVLCVALVFSALLCGCSKPAEPPAEKVDEAVSVGVPAPEDGVPEEGQAVVEAPERILSPAEELVANVSKHAAEGLVCVVEYMGNDVSFLTVDGVELDKLNVGVNPAALAVTADGSQLYVANYGNGEVVRITLGDEPAVERVRVGTRPMALVLDEARGLLYVADYYLNSIRILDTTLMSLVGTVKLEPKGFQSREIAPACCSDPLDGTVIEGRRPVSLAMSADGTTLYCANIGTYDVSIIDLEERVELTQRDGVIGVRDVVVSPDGAFYVLAGVGSDLIESNELLVYDAALGTEVARVFIGKDVGGVAWSGSTLVAIAKETGEFCVVDPETWSVSASMQFEPGIADVSLSRDGSCAYVGNSDTGDVSCIDMETLEVLWTVEGLADPRFILAL